VVANWWREPRWHPLEFAPYQVQLDAWDPSKARYTARCGTGNLIYAPHDDDDYIRACSGDVKAPAGGMCWTLGERGGGRGTVDSFHQRLKAPGFNR
jgi:hypothetical protein